MWDFLLNLEEHSVYYSNKHQPLCASFFLETGINKFFHTSAQMGISCIKYVYEEFGKQILKFHSRLKFLEILSIYRR